MDPTQIIVNALVAAIVASFYAYMGYKKNKKEVPLMEFDMYSAAFIIIPTVLVSLVASFTGLAPDILSNTSFSLVLTKIVKKVLQAT